MIRKILFNVFGLSFIVVSFVGIVDILKRMEFNMVDKTFIMFLLFLFTTLLNSKEG